MRVALTLALATLLLIFAACSDDQDDNSQVGGSEGPAVTDETVQEATVEQILADPDAFEPNEVRVRGQAYPVQDVGFVLRSDGKNLLVAAPRSDLSQIEAGEEVTVTGDLEQLSETKADNLQDALDTIPEAAEPGSVQLPEKVGPDEPILNLRAIEGA